MISSELDPLVHNPIQTPSKSTTDTIKSLITSKEYDKAEILLSKIQDCEEKHDLVLLLYSDLGRVSAFNNYYSKVMSTSSPHFKCLYTLRRLSLLKPHELYPTIQSSLSLFSPDSDYYIVIGLEGLKRLLMADSYEKSKKLVETLQGPIKTTKRVDLSRTFIVFQVILELSLHNSTLAFQLLSKLFEIVDEDQDDLTMTDNLSSPSDSTIKYQTLLLSCLYQFNVDLDKFTIFLDELSEMNKDSGLLVLFKIDLGLIKSEYAKVAELLITCTREIYDTYQEQVMYRWKCLYDALGNEKGREIGVNLSNFYGKTIIIDELVQEYEKVKQTEGRIQKEGLLNLLKKSNSQILTSNILLDLAEIYELTAKGKSKVMRQKGLEIAQKVGNLELLNRYGLLGLEKAVEEGQRVLKDAGLW